MEISAISAVSPRQIDWRKLTAKEIIKYEQQGVDVPNEYLQWAKQFQADIKSAENDDTTYEMAAGASANVTIANTSQDNSQSDEDNDENLTASERKAKLLSSGESYYSIAYTFSKESAENAKESELSSQLISEMGSSSDSKVETLESSLDSLMSQADDLKSQINSLKNKKESSVLGNLTKIKQLERQLKALGIQGQTMAGAVDSDLTDYKSEISSQNSSNSAAIDLGLVTKDMGSNIKRSDFWLAPIGAKIEKNGKNAVEKGQDALNTGTDIAQQNSDNLSKVHNLESEIRSKTGVGGIAESSSTEENGENGAEDGSESNSNDPANQQTKDIAASGNMNEILQYKIRKGEIEA